MECAHVLSLEGHKSRNWKTKLVCQDPTQLSHDYGIRGKHLSEREEHERERVKNERERQRKGDRDMHERKRERD